MEENIKKEEKKEESKKLSYEELEQVANNLNVQCKQLYSKLCEAQEVIASFNNIGMLLSVLEKAEYFDSEFITRSAKKIQDVVSQLLDKSDAMEKEQNEQEKK